MNALPPSIGNLIHLRYFNISDCGLESLPDSLGYLKNLQTLDMSGNNCRSYLLQLVICNRSYCMFSVERIVKEPGEIEKGTCIMEVVKVYLSKMPFGIRQMTQLQLLQEFIRVRDSTKAKAANLLSKENLSLLIMKWSDEEGVVDIDAEAIIEALQPPPNIRSLPKLRIQGSSSSFVELRILLSTALYCVSEGLQNLISLQVLEIEDYLEFPNYIQDDKMCNGGYALARLGTTPWHALARTLGERALGRARMVKRAWASAHGRMDESAQGRAHMDECEACFSLAQRLGTPWHILARGTGGLRYAPWREAREARADLGQSTLGLILGYFLLEPRKRLNIYYKERCALSLGGMGRLAGTLEHALDATPRHDPWTDHGVGHPSSR
ncbi:hypothetical protein Syun_029996 [Stephania yunnanensis]|uniref:Disease resistance R13L4/SHOC-2-like LRR domain-containing protein n=1 Tax=Stephania yunnanensis TaxID=152371 RepID=A0AAP0EB61_9MAGN